MSEAHVSRARNGSRGAYEDGSTAEGHGAALDAGLLSPVRAGTPVESAVSDSAWLQAALDAEAALARAQARLGTLPPPAARTITETARAHPVDLRTVAVRAREHANPIVTLVAEFTRAVAERDPAAAEYVHRGSTSQDIFDTGAMLVTARALELIRADLRAAAEALRALARRHRDTPIAGRTLALQAVPSTFGLKAAGWRSLVQDAADRVERLLAGGLPVSLGGAAGTLAGYLEYAGIDGAGQPARPGAQREEGYERRLADAFAEETGLARQALPWHALRTPIADAAGVLAFTAGALGKIAADVLTLSRTEIGEVAEPGPQGRGASSAMPHKRNPVLATMIRSVAIQVPALAAGLTQCLTAEDERSGGAWHAEWQPLRECLRLVGGATHTLRELCEGLQVRPDRMAQNLDRTASALTSERLAAVLSPLLGRARSRALLTRCAEQAARSGTPMSRVLAEELRGEPGAAALTEPELADLCAPANYTGAATALVNYATAASR